MKIKFDQVLLKKNGLIINIFGRMSSSALDIMKNLDSRSANAL